MLVLSDLSGVNDRTFAMRLEARCQNEVFSKESR